MSGLLLFARSPQAASALCAQIESRGVEKVYVARVLGRFPEPPPGQQFVVADVPLDWDAVANMASAVPEAAAAAAGAAADGPAADAAGDGSAAAAAGAAGDGNAAAAAAAAGDGNAAAGQAADVEQQQQQQQVQEQQQGDATGEGLSREDRKRLKKQQRSQRRAAKAERQEAAAAAAAAAAKRPGKSIPKPALTEFRLLGVAPDGRTSLVECRWVPAGLHGWPEARGGQLLRPACLHLGVCSSLADGW